MSCRMVYQTRTYFDGNIDFGKYRTFAITFDESKVQDTIDLQQAIGKEILYQMALRGYKEAPFNPELAVRFDMFPQTVLLNDYMPNPELSSNQTRVLNPNAILYGARGTLLVRVFDIKKQELVWASYIDRLHRFGKWTPNLMRTKTKNILLKYPFQKEKSNRK